MFCSFCQSKKHVIMNNRLHNTIGGTTLTRLRLRKYRFAALLCMFIVISILILNGCNQSDKQPEATEPTQTTDPVDPIEPTEEPEESKPEIVSISIDPEQ